jgi:hypothetical protein
LFEKIRIRTLIKRGLDQVPHYLWPDDLSGLTLRQRGEVADLVCRATKECWNWDSLKDESVFRKAIFSLNLYATGLKAEDIVGDLVFTKAAEAIASLRGELDFHAQVAMMFEKNPP